MDGRITIPESDVVLHASLEVPPGARAIVVFAHGSGSSQHSPRNRYVASILRHSGLIGTLLFDLLTPEEDLVYANRFDTGLLAERLEGAVRYLDQQSEYRDLSIGLFGASTGAASALIVAARIPERIKALVSRGGRPDLAADSLGSVTTPSLFIVGSLDAEVLEINRHALDRVPATDKALEVIIGATHLFEEAGALEDVAELACDWFERFLLG